MLLAIVRSNSLLLRGPCDKGARIQKLPDLTDGAVMALLVPQACLERRRTFTPMLYSADGIPRAEALAAQNRLAVLLSYKMKREYAIMCSFVLARMSLAIVRSNSLLLCGPCEKGAHLAATRSDGWGGDGMGTTTLFDIVIIIFDAGSYLRMTPEKALAEADKEKKDSYLQACLGRRRTFTPMVYSADGIPRAEALDAHKTLATLLSYKLKREYSEM